MADDPFLQDVPVVDGHPPLTPPVEARFRTPAPATPCPGPALGDTLDEARALLSRHPGAAFDLLGQLDARALPPGPRADLLVCRADALARMHLGAGRPSGFNPNRETCRLEKALAAYREAYTLDTRRNVGAGVRYVALLTRARREATGVGGAFSLEGRHLAEQLQKQLIADPLALESPLTRTWIAELALALDDLDLAVDALGRAVRDPLFGAEDLVTVEEHMRTIWGLEHDSSPGDRLLPMLTAGLLARGISQKLAPEYFDRAWLAGATEITQYAPLRWLLRGTERLRGVAELRLGGGRKLGHGALVLGSTLGPGCAHEPVLLAPSTLLSPNRAIQQRWGATSPEHVLAVFPHGRAFATLTTSQVIWHGSPDHHGLIAFRLNDWPRDRFGDPLAPIPLAPEMPGQVSSTLTTVEFTGAGGMWLSRQGHTTRDVRRLTTDRGQRAMLPGSPVFDAQWRLKGLHHQSDPELGVELIWAPPTIPITAPLTGR